MSDISVTYDENEARPAIYFQGVQNIRLNHILINNKNLEKNKALLVMKSSSMIN